MRRMTSKIRRRFPFLSFHAVVSTQTNDTKGSAMDGSMLSSVEVSETVTNERHGARKGVSGGSGK
jgi:hypothetical protein